MNTTLNHPTGPIEAAGRLLSTARRILVITGAGLSADSGLPTYRGVGGLYEGALTDIGLPIVQALLHKHDGSLLLRSKLREGTEAIAILPAKRVLQSLPAVTETQAVAPRKKSFA